jgi:hypothetical protein
MLAAALAATACGFMAPTPHTHLQVKPRCTQIKAIGIEGDLPRMYRERWQDDIATPAKTKESMPAKVLGACSGVAIATFAGIQVSEALTDHSLSLLNFGNTFDTVSYVDTLMRGVDAINQVMPNTGELSFAIAVGLDVSALASVMYLASILIQAQQEDGKVNDNAQEAGCIITESNGETLCGDLSFDSTDDFVCVETLSSEGKVRWVCSGDMRYAA